MIPTLTIMDMIMLKAPRPKTKNLPLFDEENDMVVMKYGAKGDLIAPAYSFKGPTILS